MALTVFQRRLFLLGLLVLFYLTFTLEAARSWAKNSERNYDDLILNSQGRQKSRSGRRYAALRESRRHGNIERSEKPNIILVLTDDQDELLGMYILLLNT